MVIFSIKKILLILSFFLFNSIIVLADDETPIVKVGVFQVAPLVYIDDNGSPQGVFVDIIKEIANSEGWNIEFIKGTWNDCMERGRSGQIDLMTSVMHLDRRESFLDFPKESVLNIWGQVYIHKDSDISGVFGLKGKTIGVLKGGANGENFIELLSKFDITCKITTFDSLKDIADAVQDKKADAGVFVNFHGYNYEQSHQIKQTQIVFNPSYLKFATAAGTNQHLLLTISDYLSKWKNDRNSPYHKIIKKHLGLSEVKDIPIWLWTLVVSTIGISLFISFFLVFFNKKLKKKVAQATKELSSSEKKFKEFIEGTDDLVTRVDKNGSFIYVNHMSEKIFGIPSEEIPGMDAFDFVHTDDQKRTQNWFEDCIRKNIFKASFENKLVNKTTGKIFDFLWTITFNYDQEGQLIAVNGLAHNITHRKKAEEALRSSKQKLDLHFLQTPLAVIEWDLEFKVKSWNPAAQSIFGYSEKEILGKHASTIVVEKDKGQIDTVWAELLHQKGGIRSTNMNFAKNGDILFCEWFNTPVTDEGGNVIAVFSLVQNITERKQAEETLQIERDKLAIVINGINDSMYIVNKDYIVEFQNIVSRKQFGDLLGKKCYEKIFQKNKPCDFCLMHETLDGNCVQQLEIDNLNQKHYEVTFSPFQETREEMKCVLISRDVTEKKALQAEAMRVGHLASLGELAAGVAHEINNPVTGIISIAEILADKFHEFGGDKKIPERIINEGERIGKIVKNLLSFARDQKEEYHPAQIKEILQLSLDLVEKQIFRDGIHLSIDIPSDTPKIKMNRQEIQQVFLNLLSNARYAINKKYPDPHENKILDIKAEIIDIKEEKHVRVTLHDQGMGIPKSFLDKISDPFFSTKPQGEGTGLGLSISHGIIKSHGGKLWFESREGEYTKVMIDLPVYDA